MRNKFEGGLQARELPKWVNPKNITFDKALLAAAVTVLAVNVGKIFVGANREGHKQLTEPKRVYEDIAARNDKFIVEYNDQNQPKCVGDVEKTVPQIENGVVKGLTVYCKTEAVQPAK